MRIATDHGDEREHDQPDHEDNLEDSQVELGNTEVAHRQYV